MKEKSKIPLIEELIVRGRGDLAQVELRKILAGKVPRQEAPRLAELAWRAGLPLLGAKLLFPFVHPPARRPTKASNEEKAEYAHCLIKLGALSEGEELLNSLDARANPRIFFYRASARIARWDYRRTIPPLRAYIKSRGPSPYQKAVAKVNLAAALVFEREVRQATPLLRELLHLSSLRGFHLMLGRVMEICAENLIARKKWEQAEAFLKQSSLRLKDSAGIDAFLSRKFEIFIRYQRSGGKPSAARELEALRREARALGHWETLRSIDFVKVITRRDKALFLHLYHGTPYAHFREKLVEELGSDFPDASSPPLWVLKAHAGQNLPVLDLSTGFLDGKQVGLKPGSIPQRMLLALTGDFYRPFRLSELFVRLHPDRPFDPIYSTAQVHDALGRLRAWIDEVKLPVAIEVHHGFFRLSAKAPFAIQIGSGSLVGTRHGGLAHLLKAAFPDKAFGISDAIKATGIPRRTLVRQLAEAVFQGVLVREGRARASRYCLAEPHTIS